MHKYIKLFEDFSRIYEADTLEMSGLAKRIYNDLKREGMDVSLSYQNETMAKRSKTKELGDSGGMDKITVAYATDPLGKEDYIHVLGLPDENYARDLANRYESENVSGEVSYSYESWKITFKLKQEDQRMKYELGRGYETRKNKNDRKRRRRD